VPGASQSVEEGAAGMRQAAAEARHHLLELAAARLDVPLDRLDVVDGCVTVRGTDRRTTYWQLLGGRPFGRTATGAVAPKRAEDYRIVGRAARRIDLIGLVTGTARYVQDLVRPGMLHARVIRPPSPGARLAGVGAGPVRAMPGVAAVVRDGSFLGVVAAREEGAARAMAALRERAAWLEEETLPPADDLPAWLLAQPSRSFRVVDGVAGDEPIPSITTPPAAVRTPAAACAGLSGLHASLGPAGGSAEGGAGGLTVGSHPQFRRGARDQPRWGGLPDPAFPRRAVAGGDRDRPAGGAVPRQRGGGAAA